MFKFLCASFAASIIMISVPAWTAEKTEADNVKKASKVKKADKAEKIEKAPLVFTQKDLAKMIVAQFGWTEGLPKDAADRDYYVILGGKRNFRYEAENSYNPETDMVTIRNFLLYGSFTGKGWMLGISEPTTANFSVLVPISGEYSFKGVVKGNGFVWKIGDKELKGGSAARRFTMVDFGTISVKAGVIKVRTDLPIDGGIDSFSLVAPDYRSIQPFAGWRFREPLTVVRMAEVGVAMMDHYHLLPEDRRNPVKPLEVVDVVQPASNLISTDVKFLGAFSARAWLRANDSGAVIQIPIKIDESGFYNLRARVMGDKINGDVNGVPFLVAGKPYLAMTDFGLFRLEAGDNILTLKLPPLGGIDIVDISQKDSSPAEFMKLAGFTGDPERLVKADEALAYIKQIREKYPVRK